MDNLVGKRLDGRYEISELIGIGGMAVVYKAYDNIDDRTVAIKILKEEFLANAEFRRRFQNESKAIAVLSHPNIVKVYDVSFGDVLQYIVMEYVDGITLKDYIKQRGVIDWREAIHFTAQILKALEHAHEKGIIHRDIKPQNIMLLRNGEIKVTDFGIARFSRSSQPTMTEKAIGSVHYISPEQARGDFTDGRSDIYSVGIMLYEMITGRVPFQSDSAVSVAIMQLQNEPDLPTVINPSLPRGIEEITLKAMQKNPDNRFETAREMLYDLEEIRMNERFVFNYKYNASDSPTKPEKVREVRPERKKRVEKNDNDEEKSPVVAVLGGIAAIFIVAAVALVLVFFKFFSDTGATGSCPNLVGLVYNEVISSDEYKKYNIELESTEYNSEYPEGQIFRQSPEADKTIKEGTVIKVKVSKGAQSMVLEDYSNQEFSRVKELLTNDLGLKVTQVDQSSDSVNTGYIIETIPPAGSNIRTGDTVTVYVSTGKEVQQVKIDNYTGMNYEQAETELERKGLDVKIMYTDSSEYPMKGYVIRQSVEKGYVDKGLSITLYVSSGNLPTATTTQETTEEVTEAPTEEPTQEASSDE